MKGAFHEHEYDNLEKALHMDETLSIVAHTSTLPDGSSGSAQYVVATTTFFRSPDGIMPTYLCTNQTKENREESWPSHFFERDEKGKIIPFVWTARGFGAILTKLL